MREVNCAFCGKLFTTKRRDAKCCGKWCSGKYSSMKKNYYKLNKKKKEIEIKDKNIRDRKLEVYLDIKKYVLKVKSRKFMCDDVDVYRLIHFYEIINPSSWDIPKLNSNVNDIELVMGEMFIAIAKWYKETELIYEGENKN